MRSVPHPACGGAMLTRAVPVSSKSEFSVGTQLGKPEPPSIISSKSQPASDLGIFIGRRFEHGEGAHPAVPELAPGQSPDRRRGCPESPPRKLRIALHCGERIGRRRGRSEAAARTSRLCLQGSRKGVNIHRSTEIIWGIPAQSAFFPLPLSLGEKRRLYKSG